MTITSCATCPLHTQLQLYERCSYPKHERNGTDLFNQCPLITVGKIEIEYEKQTSETQTITDDLREGERE